MNVYFVYFSVDRTVTLVEMMDSYPEIRLIFGRNASSKTVTEKIVLICIVMTLFKLKFDDNYTAGIESGISFL